MRLEYVIGNGDWFVGGGLLADDLLAVHFSLIKILKTLKLGQLIKSTRHDHVVCWGYGVSSHIYYCLHLEDSCVLSVRGEMSWLPSRYAIL